MANWNEGLEVAAVSDVGMRRSNNQDSYAAVLAGDQREWFQRGHVFVVADGMGAHAAGELASKMATDNVPHTYHKLVNLSPPAAIQKSIMEANTMIHSRGIGSVDFQGMGTTCSSLILQPFGALVGHVGDSRVYRLRQNKLEQLTFDHSLIWEMMVAGNIDPADEAAVNVPKNVITRSLGPNARVQVDVEGYFQVDVDDIYLLCSDGLTGPVSDQEIGVILGSVPVEDAVQTLVDLANLRGGPDNITAIAVRVTAPQMIDQKALERMRGGGGGRSVHPALWIAAAVCLLASIVLWLFDAGPLPVALGVLGGLVAGGVGIMQRLDAGPVKKNTNAAGPFGKGPHREYDCQANQVFVDKLAETVTKLHSAAKTDGWPINWETFERFRDDGAAAAASEDYSTAVVQFCHAIRFMIKELRELRKKQSEGRRK